MNANQDMLLSVPGGWDEDKDQQYFRLERPGKMSPNEVLEDIPDHVRCCHGALDGAFEFLTGGNRNVFWPSSMQGKVAVLRKLFPKRNKSKAYLERMESDLQSFVDVEHVYLPMVERYAVEHEGLWLRQLIEIRLAIYGTYLAFEESMRCEHDSCPQFE